MDTNHQDKQDLLKNTELGLLVSSTLKKLEYISDYHVKERRKHFRITNVFVKIISVFLFLIALVNIYYLYDFYHSTMNIIETSHKLDDTVVDITKTMTKIDHSMKQFETNMRSIPEINQNVNAISVIMPNISNSMNNVHGNMKSMNSTMTLVNHDLHFIEFHVQGMRNNVNHLGRNIYQIAEPISMFNSVLP